MFNINHNLFGYPRYSEMEIDCVSCNGTGEKRCRDEDCDEKCDKCNGKGRTSIQSQWNVYTMRQDEETENKHQDAVKYYPFPTDNLIYSRDTYKETLKLAEKYIYVQSRVETGKRGEC